MHKYYSIPLLIMVFSLISAGHSRGQSPYVPEFLQTKQAWEQKLIVLYAPEHEQHLIREQLNLMYPDVHKLTKEKITVVHIPARLSAANRQYLQKKLKVQTDRLNFWIIDEKGNLRMSSTKLTPVSQMMRVLDIDTRPHAVASAQILWDY